MRYKITLVMVVVACAVVIGTTGALAQELCLSAPADVKGMTWDGTHLWVADGPIVGDDFIRQVDPTTGEVGVSFIAPSRFPSGLAFDGEHLWLVDTLNDLLYQIDRSTGETLRTIPSRGRQVTGVTWDGTALWVYDKSAALLLQLNPEDGTILDVHRAPTQSGEGLAWDGNHLWLTSFFETFKIDPEDGDIFESIDEGSLSAVTFDGEGLRLGSSRDQICRLAIDTSAGISVSILPGDSRIAQTQMFDLILLVKTPGVTVENVTLTFDLFPVTAFPIDPLNPPSPETPQVVQRLATCFIPGTVQARPAQTFRCPGLSGDVLQVGLHVLRAAVDLSDGRTVRRSATWRVFDNSEL